ncbi:MAG: hypothetical protein IKR81_01715, partial [Victivallales bacterium]|nr:hypothetical protein [Victivallales bacterium]
MERRGLRPARSKKPRRRSAWAQYGRATGPAYLPACLPRELFCPRGHADEVEVLVVGVRTEG